LSEAIDTYEEFQETKAALAFHKVLVKEQAGRIRDLQESLREVMAQNNELRDELESGREVWG